MSMRVWVGLGRCGAACLAGVAHVRPLSGLRLAVTLGFRVPNYEYFRAAVGVRVPWRPTDENGTASKQNPNPWMNAELVELDEPPLEVEAYPVKEVLKILIHSIVFQRALGECNMCDTDSDLLDISYIRCASRTISQRVSDYAESFSSALERTTEQAKTRAAAAAAAALQQEQQQQEQHAGGSSGAAAGGAAGVARKGAEADGVGASRAGALPIRVPAKICVAFFEKRNRPGAFGLFRGEEKVVWERWNIGLSIRIPEAAPEPSTGVLSMVGGSSQSSDEGEARRRRQQQQLADDLRARLELILTTASARKEHIPPADGLCGETPWFEVTSDSESWGAFDIFKLGFARMGRAPI